MLYWKIYYKNIINYYVYIHIMVKVQKSIKVENDEWQEFMEKYDNGSKKIREMIRKDLNRENPTPEVIKICDLDVLTPKQEKLAERLIEADLPIKNEKAGKIAREDNLYSRRDHVRTALNSITGLDDVPIEYGQDDFGGGKKYQFTDFECEGDCESTLSIGLLKNNDWKCPSCNQKYEVEV